jgi:hypothetical protein
MSLGSHWEKGEVKRLIGFLAVVIAVACGSNDPTPAPSVAESPSTSPSAEPVAPLVGRWERVNTCQEHVEVLRKAGLEEIAPTMVAGNGYVPGTPQQLARRADLCKGAKPRVHAHFFTADGRFGSLDWNDEPVDDGTYTIVNDTTFQIGDTTFHYEIINGDTLMLEPVVPKKAKAEALADPEEFSVAGWSVSVAFEGHPWKRVDCEGWC